MVVRADDSVVFVDADVTVVVYNVVVVVDGRVVVVVVVVDGLVTTFSKIYKCENRLELGRTVLDT